MLDPNQNYTFGDTQGALDPSGNYSFGGTSRELYREAPQTGIETAMIIGLEVVPALVGGFAQIIFLANFFFSIKKGPKSPQNPWKSNTLEWTAPVEHMHGNWPGEIPHVHRWPYDYRKLDANGELWGGQDFTPQNVPIREGEEEF